MLAVLSFIKFCIQCQVLLHLQSATNVRTKLRKKKNSRTINSISYEAFYPSPHYRGKHKGLNALNQMLGVTSESSSNPPNLGRKPIKRDQLKRKKKNLKSPNKENCPGREWQSSPVRLSWGDKNTRWLPYMFYL